MAAAVVTATLGALGVVLLGRDDVEVNLTQPAAPAVVVTVPVPVTWAAPATPSVITTIVPLPTSTIAATTSPATTSPATTAPATTAVPATTGPTTVPSTTDSSTTVPLDDARAQYAAIAARWNPVLARLDRDFDRLTDRTARDICALLARAYRDLYLDLQGQVWPATVRPSVDALVLSAAALEAELRRCARASTGWKALTVARSGTVDRLTEQVGRAATTLRIALGIPSTAGLALPDRAV